MGEKPGECSVMEAGRIKHFIKQGMRVPLRAENTRTKYDHWLWQDIHEEKKLRWLVDVCKFEEC